MKNPTFTPRLLSINLVGGKSGRGDALQRGASYGKDPRTALHNREVARG
jgi:hypothetical protein